MLRLYLEVDKIEPPLRNGLHGVQKHKQAILDVADSLAAEGILCGGVDAPVPDESCCLAVRLQLHGFQSEPVPCRHGIISLTHAKTGDQKEVVIRINHARRT